ncbi:hypothetical protein LAZ67_11002317 [Cordylochernes scorpioides]|uniref:Uncharacterized protein n=1 Tax=Cordylochernes scorpioides TaxID=51811 RepID=A0ABY6KZ57_9ARAC|nr:hypothetical protein LAZ67_11002317 [Cordylochernes scorpioides]
MVLNSGYRDIVRQRGGPTAQNDLAPCDYFLFPKVKSLLKEIKFDTDDEALQDFINAVNFIPEDDWCKCFNNWFLRMKSCIGAKARRVASRRVDDPARRCQEILTTERPTRRCSPGWTCIVWSETFHKNGIHGAKDPSDREAEGKSH